MIRGNLWSALSCTQPFPSLIWVNCLDHVFLGDSERIGRQRIRKAQRSCLRNRCSMALKKGWSWVVSGPSTLSIASFSCNWPQWYLPRPKLFCIAQPRVHTYFLVIKASQKGIRCWKIMVQEAWQSLWPWNCRYLISSLLVTWENNVGHTDFLNFKEIYHHCVHYGWKVRSSR